MRKHCRRKHFALVNPIAHVLDGIAVTPEALLDGLRLRELSAIESFATGRATREDWHALADMANVCEVMAVDFGIGDGSRQAAEGAQAALQRAFERAARGKALGLDGPGLQALRDCFAWHDAQRTNVARSVYERAIKRTADKIRGKAPGVKVLA